MSQLTSIRRGSNWTACEGGDVSRPLKIGIATWAPFVGGAEVAAERLALGLQEAGHDVFVVLGQQGEVFERMERAGVRCVHSPMHFTDKWHWFRYRQARKQLTQLFERERPDVIHSNDLPTHQMVAEAGQRAGVPCVSHHRFPFPGSAIDWLNKFPAARHLFVSAALMNEMCGESSRLAASERVVVYDGLPLPVVPNAAERIAARKRLGLPTDKLIVNFAGQIIERKGVAELIRAWAALVPRWQDRAELVVVGDDIAEEGKYRVEMEALARELGCPARFVGFQKNVPEWLTASDFSVVPSHVEPLGNATLEAMSYGLPVIGTRVGGIPEMIVAGETGLLVPAREPEALAAAMESLLSDGGLRQRLGRGARARCELKFSLAAHVASVLEQYRIVLAGATAGAAS